MDFSKQRHLGSRFYGALNWPYLDDGCLMPSFENTPWAGLPFRPGEARSRIPAIAEVARSTKIEGKPHLLFFLCCAFVPRRRRCGRAVTRAPRHRNERHPLKIYARHIRWARCSSRIKRLHLIAIRIFPRGFAGGGNHGIIHICLSVLLITAPISLNCPPLSGAQP
jgi:hypothetical protein